MRRFLNTATLRTHLSNKRAMGKIKIIQRSAHLTWQCQKFVRYYIETHFIDSPEALETLRHVAHRKKYTTIGSIFQALAAKSAGSCSQMSFTDLSSAF